MNCNKKFGVAQKVIWFRQKRVDVARKSIQCHQKKVDVAQKSTSCRQKQHDAESRRYFVRKKVIFFQNGAPYYTTHPKAYQMDCKICKTRSSRSQMFFKIGFAKNFAFFKGKRLCSSLFLVKLQAFRDATLLKRDSNTGVFLCNL